MQRILLSLIISGSVLCSRMEAATCDRRAEPWLDKGCHMPEVKNLNQACRYSSYMKAKKIDPYEPALRHYKDALLDLDWPESWEQFAFETCEAIKNSQCATISRTLYERLNLIAGEAIGDYRMAIPTFVEAPQSSDVDMNIVRNFEYLASQNRDILLLIEKTVSDIETASATISTYEQLMAGEQSLQNVFGKLRLKVLDQSRREMLLVNRMDAVVASIESNGLA
ncbi:MAG: hypothetical protein NTX25_02500, partial [Proteobacteria bacterium]|nr:hypothetical protein [Pseudomonadota bacterium]